MMHLVLNTDIKHFFTAVITIIYYNFKYFNSFYSALLSPVEMNHFSQYSDRYRHLFYDVY